MAIIQRGVKKSTFQEFLICDKTFGRDCQEDRGYKHLYERHHFCSGGASCKAFCGKNECTRVNYKRDDIYQVESEEMPCDNVNVNYHKLAQFYEQRSQIDLKMKVDTFNTLIPPPISPKDKKVNGVHVYVTEINSDFSCVDVTPCTVQDPTWVNYDVD